MSRLSVVPGTGLVIAFWTRSRALTLHRSDSSKRLNSEDLPTLVQPDRESKRNQLYSHAFYLKIVLKYTGIL